MSKDSLNSSNQKEMVVTVTRYGQVIATYRNFDDAAIICKDFMIKGVPFVLSVNFIQ